MKNLQNQATILLIENNADWSADVYSVLKEAGYDVLTATGGDVGFCAARRVRPDLIICEDALPDISGIQLCYMIRADKNLHAALFILMGESNGQGCNTILEGFRAGADEYFEKSCNRQVFAAKIAQLIALQRPKVELRERFHNLRRSELHLTKIIEDTYNLVAALDPAIKFLTFDEHYIPEPTKTFSQSIHSKNRMSKKNVNILETWQQALQPREFINTDKSGNGSREKVYYEIVY